MVIRLLKTFAKPLVILAKGVITAVAVDTTRRGIESHGKKWWGKSDPLPTVAVYLHHFKGQQLTLTVYHDKWSADAPRFLVRYDDAEKIRLGVISRVEKLMGVLKPQTALKTPSQVLQYMDHVIGEWEKIVGSES